MDSNLRFRARRNQEISVSRWSSTDLVYGTVARISAEPPGRHTREQYRADKCPVDGEAPSREALEDGAEGPRSRQKSSPYPSRRRSARPGRPPPYPGLANKLSAGATQDGLRKVRFALDSSLEGAGSEPSAPLEAARRRRQIPPRPHLAAQDGGYIKAGRGGTPLRPCGTHQDAFRLRTRHCARGL
jgi:hypothetical protein